MNYLRIFVQPFNLHIPPSEIIVIHKLVCMVLLKNLRTLLAVLDKWLEKTRAFAILHLFLQKGNYVNCALALKHFLVKQAL
jgi:hypothetical protein